MESLKKWIIFIIIAIIIILIVLMVLLNYKQEEESEIPITDNNTESSDIYNYETAETEVLTDKTSFYTVAQCVSAYLDVLNKNNSSYFGVGDQGEQVKVIDDAEIAQMILNVLDKQYIQTNNISANNVYQYVENVTKKELFVPLKMNIIPGRKVEKYAVYGFTEDMDHKFIRTIYVIVNLDVQNYTYSIEPILNNNIQNIDEIKLTLNDTNIEKNDNNLYQYENINDGYISNKYLDSYKKMLLSNPKVAYEYLDGTYKQARFGSYENFANWIQNNKEAIAKIALEKYQVEIRGNDTQYVCIDTKSHNYIFRATAPMQYTVLLDTYTIDLPEFATKYASSTNEQKVLLNIQKFFEAINNSDYEYAYKKLDATYKSNNFSTLAEFETYVKQNFFEQNKLTAGKAEVQEDIYLYSITISDASGQNTNKVTKTFVMQLQEGTDFVMSFNK